MGDPVTMAMIGASVGAMTNKRDPLKGALLGAAGGAAGGAFMGGAMGAGNAASTAAMTGAKAVPVGASGLTTLPAAPGAAGIFATPTMPTYAATGGTTGLIGSTTAPVTIGNQLSGGMSALNTFANQNPVATQVGLGALQSAMTPEPPPQMAPPPGLARGQQFQMEQPTQYAMGSPRISLI
jgi:hypothetical protein